MRRWLVLAAGLAVALGCVRLGVWQLRRLSERRALGALIQERQQRPPVDLEILARGLALGSAGSGDRAPASSDTVAYRRVAVQGRFDFSRQVVVVSRAREGIPGVWVVTPLVLPGGAAILTERGWVPSPDAYRVALDSLREPEAQLVEGVLLEVRSARPLLPPGSGWPLYLATDDPRALAARFPYPVLPWVLRRSAAGAGAPERLRPLSVPLPGSGPHLSYAIQWFAFAAIALAGSVLLFRREAAGPRAPAEGDRGPAARQPGRPGGG